jgi:hypothetical protein
MYRGNFILIQAPPNGKRKRKDPKPVAFLTTGEKYEATLKKQ